MCANQDLADGVVPDAAKEVDGLLGRAPSFGGRADDGLDHLQRRLAEAAQEAVGGEDLGSPRPGGERVVDGDGRCDDAISRIAGQVAAQRLLGMFVEQLDQQILAVAHVVVQGRRPDPELSSQPAHREPLPAIPVDDLPGGVQDLRTGGQWRSASATVGSGHEPIILRGSRPRNGAGRVVDSGSSLRWLNLKLSSGFGGRTGRAIFRNMFEKSLRLRGIRSDAQPSQAQPASVGKGPAR
ncbi:hypothetical protein GCM10027605_29440 [Micromonospora zhanjiangensis]